jgi:UDP:flavonoid glycosyltransferase YjiC (YdhE family)
MRILITTRGSSGHLLPLAPLARAARGAGHEVLVAAQRQHAANVERAGLPFTPVADPPPEEWMPLLGEFGRLRVDESDARMIGDFFADIDLRAALPGLRAVVREWRPDVLVRDCWEFAATLVAEEAGLPLARVALGLAEIDARSARLAAPAVDRARAAAGLPGDPAGERLRAGPYLTGVPDGLEDPAAPAPPGTLRFGAGAPSPPAAARRRDPPLVYVSFGTVTGQSHLPYFPDLHRTVLEALAALPVRVVVTVGPDADPAELGPLPPRVRAERWLPQADVLAEAAVAVCHGGYGTVLGALAHGVPLVVLPLFSADQWINGAAVRRAGAGLALDAERHTRPVLGLPGLETLAALAPAVARVLADPAAAAAAARVGAELRALPAPEGAIAALQAEVAGRFR